MSETDHPIQLVTTTYELSTATIHLTHNYGPYVPLQNVSSFNSTDEFQAYLDSYYGYRNFESIRKKVSGSIDIACAIIGIFSATLTLATICRNSNFSAHCFTCYRFIALCELFYAPFKIATGLMNIISDSSRKLYAWQFVNVKIVPSGNICSIFVDLLIVYLSVERAVACLLPTKFHLIDKQCVSYFVVCCVFTIAFGFSIIEPLANNVEYDLKSQKYVGTLASWWSEEAEETYNGVMQSYVFTEALLVLLSTAFAIAGMVKSMYSRIRIVRRASHYDTGHRVERALDQSTVLALSQKLQLCYLQLTQAIPLIVNGVLFALVVFHSPKNIGSLSFDDAHKRQYIILFVNFFDGLAHCFHFFLYVTFSKSFRSGFMQRFFPKKPEKTAVASNGGFVVNFKPEWLENGRQNGTRRKAVEPSAVNAKHGNENETVLEG